VLYWRCPAWRRVVPLQVSLFAHPLRGLLRSLPGNSAGGRVAGMGGSPCESLSHATYPDEETQRPQRAGVCFPMGSWQGVACRGRGLSAAPGAGRRVGSGRALPACHENKETQRGREASFFSRPRKRAANVRAGLRPAPRALPRVGRMPPPGPPGLRPLCAVRHTGTCYRSSSGEGVEAWGEGRGREGGCGGRGQAQRRKLGG
jgi:hypothetical protein